MTATPSVIGTEGGPALPPPLGPPSSSELLNAVSTKLLPKPLRTIAACCLLGVVLLGSAACAPLLTVAGSMLGGIGGGAGKAGGAGPSIMAPMSGTPSSVQNSRSNDHAIRDVLDHSEGQGIRENCLKALPPQDKPPEVHCTLRLTCVPGLNHPLMMRVCPPDLTISETRAPAPSTTKRPALPPSWHWDQTN